MRPPGPSTRWLLSVSALLVAAIVAAGCSDPGDDAADPAKPNSGGDDSDLPASEETIDQTTADAIVAAVTLDPSEIGSDLADFTSGISDETDLAACTPALAVLAHAPMRGVGTDAPEEATADNFESLLAEAAQVAYTTYVYASAGQAASAFALFAGAVGDGLGKLGDCDESDADDFAGATPVELETVAEDQAAFEVLSNDPNSALFAQQQFVLVRNGPALTVIIGFGFGEEADVEGLVVAVAEKIASAVAGVLATG